MADESGGDPSRISGKARSAAQLADAMSGLRDTFNDIMNSAQKAAVEEECAEGYPKFRDNYAETILELEEHGLQLAKNIHSGGAAIGRNDDTTEKDSMEHGLALVGPLTKAQVRDTRALGAQSSTNINFHCF